jgi:hypothetical protein
LVVTQEEFAQAKEHTITKKVLLALHCGCTLADSAYPLMYLSIKYEYAFL